MDMQEDQSSGVVAHALTSQKPKKAQFRHLQNSYAHLPFVDGEEFIGGVTIVEMRQERRNMSGNDREYPWSRKGESYDEMFSEGPFDEEEEFDPEQWPLHAASSLLSGLVIRGPES